MFGVRRILLPAQLIASPRWSSVMMRPPVLRPRNMRESGREAAERSQCSPPSHSTLPRNEPSQLLLQRWPRADTIAAVNAGPSVEVEKAAARLFDDDLDRRKVPRLCAWLDPGLRSAAGDRHR